MTPARWATWIALLIFGAILWAGLNADKNAVTSPKALTRSLIKQIQRAEPGDERVQSRFYIRYRFPEGAPNRQETLFERLFYALGECRPEEITSRSAGKMKAE